MSELFTKTEETTLLQIARQSIESKLKGLNYKLPQVEKNCKEKLGAFVTLNTVAGHKTLRGCIGRMQSDDALYITISRMALAAAFEDPRFPPVTASELQNINIEISVLSKFLLSTAEDIIIGKHGVYMIYENRSAVFLPQVATEQGWNKTELLTHLCIKAGLPNNAYTYDGVKLYVFTAHVFSEK